MDNRKYIVDEKTLLNLLAAVSELEFLETSGVDNWIGYGEGRGEFIAKKLETLTKQTVSVDKIYEESLDFMNVAEEKIKVFEIYDVPIAKAYEDDLK